MDPKDKREGDVEIDPFDDVEIIAEEEGTDDTTEHQPDGDESGNEPEDQADSDRQGPEDSEEPQEDKPQGGRAERRIRQLVTRTKVVEQALAEAEERARIAEEKAAAREAELATTQRVSVDEVERRLAAEEANLEAQYKEAAEEGDQEKLWQINKSLTQLHVNKSKVEDWKAANKAPVEKPEDKTEEKPAPKRPAWKSKTDQEQAENWVKKHGEWFGKTESAQTRAATRLALELDLELKAEGFDPADPPTGGNKQNEFYMELDKRIAEVFPTLVKRGTTGQGKQTMGSGGRSPGQVPDSGKGAKPKLTQSELDMCRRMNITPKEYDAEKKRLAARSSSRGR